MRTMETLRRCIATRPRRWFLAITLLLGLAAAVLVTAGAQPADRTFSGVSGPVQSLMSVMVPLFGVLLASDLRRTPHEARVVPTLLAVAALGAVVGLYGVIVCAIAIAAGGGTNQWDHAATVAVGGILVQVVAGLVGTGLGLLLRPPIVAFLATIVLPLGLLLVLGSTDVLRPAQAWLTPYPSVQNLLAGEMDARAWAQWLAVVMVWDVGLNAVGAALLRRRHVSASLSG